MQSYYTIDTYPRPVDVTLVNRRRRRTRVVYDPNPHRPSITQNSKRQRRQTAGALVTNLFGGGNSTVASNCRKSTAQPRPAIQIPPKGIGPIQEPNDNDVLCGRGGRINAHAGNIQFRDLVSEHKKEYLAEETKKLEKAHIAAKLVQLIRNLQPSGRFLKEEDDGCWYDIGDAKAIKKVGQALREDAPEVRTELKDGDDPKDEKRASSVSPPNSTSSSGVAPATVVSGRGAKVVAAITQRTPQQKATDPYQPLACQTLAIQPLLLPSKQAYEPVVPLRPLGYRGMVPKTQTSSAAAAAMQHEDDQHVFAMPTTPTFSDTAFGRHFHLAEVLAPVGNESMVSGLSGPASHMSALTDPMSSLSVDNAVNKAQAAIAASPTLSDAAAAAAAAAHHANYVRFSQLQQLRQQWARERSNPEQSRLSAVSAGFGSSLQRSNSDIGGRIDEMSWAEHSLLGGGIRDARDLASLASLSTFSYVSGLNTSYVPASAQGQPTRLAVATRGGSSGEDTTSTRSTNRMRPLKNSSMSVASMSLNSCAETLSIPGSIMSDLSENLIALDLAEAKLFRGL